jgi:hypothetical protein
MLHKYLGIKSDVNKLHCHASAFSFLLFGEACLNFVLEYGEWLLLIGISGEYEECLCR